MTKEEEFQVKKSLSAVVYASGAFKLCKETCDHFLQHIADDSHPLVHTFASSACVTYARPFGRNKLLGKLPESFVMLRDPALQETHDVTLFARDKLYGHTDADEKKYLVRLGIFKEKDTFRFTFDLHYPRTGGFAMERLSELCEHQRAKAKIEMIALAGQLFPSEKVRRILRAERTTSTEIEINLRALHGSKSHGA
jgi:hypothetical protein